MFNVKKILYFMIVYVVLMEKCSVCGKFTSKHSNKEARMCLEKLGQEEYSRIS